MESIDAHIELIGDAPERERGIVIISAGVMGKTAMLHHALLALAMDTHSTIMVITDEEGVPPTVTEQLDAIVERYEFKRHYDFDIPELTTAQYFTQEYPKPQYNAWNNKFTKQCTKVNKSVHRTRANLK
jgi:hypothetical protein